MADERPTMRVYWDDMGRGVESGAAEVVALDEALRIWIDEVRGVEGNFLGLIDEAGRTIQFLFQSGIPDDVEDARHLRIVLVDFPLPAKRGSYQAVVTIGEVPDLIAEAYRDRADHQKFALGPEFVAW